MMAFPYANNLISIFGAPIVFRESKIPAHTDLHVRISFETSATHTRQQKVEEILNFILGLFIVHLVVKLLSFLLAVHLLPTGRYQLSPAPS